MKRAEFSTKLKLKRITALSVFYIACCELGQAVVEYMTNNDML